jgi:cystathionine beta-lyase
MDRAGTHSVKYDERIRKFGTDDVLPLWVADMDLPSAPCITAALTKRASHPIYGYTLFPDSYYEAIQHWYQTRHHLTLALPSIVNAPSVVHALQTLVSILTHAGEGILIQTPIYPPFLKLATEGRTLLTNPLLYEEGTYRIDWSDFEHKAKQSKLFILCSPHNPTGRVWSPDELKEMLSICQKHNVRIISDEIHSDLTYLPFTSALAITQEAIILNSPSKTFNVAGLGTAYALITNDTIRRRFQQAIPVHANPFGIEALISAYREGSLWVEEIQTDLQEKICYTRAFLQNNTPDIRPTYPQATFLLWLDCRAMGLDDAALAAFFINQAQLGLNRGVEFGEEGSGFMRLNIATDWERLKQAMKQLKCAYDKI